MDGTVAWDRDDTPSVQELEISRQETDEGVLLCVAGELDLVTADQFSQHLLGEISRTDGVVILDLGGVTFMSTAGLNVLLHAGELAGPRLHMRAMSDRVRRVLELTSLTDRFPIAT